MASAGRAELACARCGFFYFDEDGAQATTVSPSWLLHEVVQLVRCDGSILSCRRRLLGDRPYTGFSSKHCHMEEKGLELGVGGKFLLLFQFDEAALTRFFVIVFFDTYVSLRRYLLLLLLCARPGQQKSERYWGYVL